MKERIKLIRKNAGLTQQDFATRIGVSRNTIATYETSNRTPIDAIVLSLCREFHVNESWLRTGQGTIYIETTPDMDLSQWFEQLRQENPDSFKIRLLLSLSKLDEKEWSVLEKLFQQLR